jgi:IclR family transcriptional regulator, pca regulon regulatory protein
VQTLGPARVEAGGSQSLERGLAVLALFSSEEPLLGASAIGRTLGLSHSTAHRYVATLASLGYLQQDADTRRYRLGPRALDLGFAAINSMPVRTVAAPRLQQLSDETGHTVNMAILDGAEVVYVERCQALHPRQEEIDLDLHLGARLPAYCTAMGKALLAFLEAPALERLLGGIELVAHGPNTIVDRGVLLSELARVRETGLAINDEELAYGLWSVAAPVSARSGKVVAAINVAVHRSTAPSGELLARFGPAVRRAAARISSELP